LAVRGKVEESAEGLQVDVAADAGADEGRWLDAAGMPQVLVVENSSIPIC
jgi:hypothetical protein